MYRSCSKCGRIHSSKEKCNAGYKEIRPYDEARKLRATYKWRKKSEQIRQDSKFLCSICLEEGIYNYKNIEVHHIEKIKENKQRLLDDNNLICLCKEHHKLADEGIISKEHLFELVEKRENGNMEI